MRFLTATILTLLSLPLAASPLYLRGGFALEQTGSTTVRDLDCGSVTPPALFGCVAGSDGRALAARGDFGDSTALELAFGTALGTRTRLELAVADRSALDLEANANFIGVAGRQPVRASGRSRSAMVLAIVDLGDSALRLRPFFAVGGGASRNESSDVVYSFPALGSESVTRIHGGSSTSAAWAVAAGATLRLNSSTDLELALRMTDLGEMRTDPGRATIVRPGRTLDLDIAGTRADVQAIGAMFSLRYRLGD